MRTLSKLCNYCPLLLVLLAATGSGFSQNSLDLYTTAVRQSRIADRMAGMERFLAAAPNSALREDALEFLVWDSLESGQREQARARAAELRELDAQNSLAIAILAESLSETAGSNRKAMQQGFELAKSGIQSYAKLRHPEGMADGEFILMQREVVCILDGETGLGFLAQKDYRNARTYLRQSIAIKPQDPRYLYGMSLALLEERNPNSQQEGYLYLARVVNLTRGSAAGEQIAGFAQQRFQEAGGTAAGWEQYLASAVIPGRQGRPAQPATVMASNTPEPRTQPATAAASPAPKPQTQPANTVASATPAPRTQSTTTTAAPVISTRPQQSATVASATPAPQSTTNAPAPQRQTQSATVASATPVTKPATTAAPTTSSSSQTQPSTTVASAAPAPWTKPATTATAPAPQTHTQPATTVASSAPAPRTQTATTAAAPAPQARTQAPAPTATASATPPATKPPATTTAVVTPTPQSAPPTVAAAKPVTKPLPATTTIASAAPPSTPQYDITPPESIPEPTFKREYVSRTAPVSMGILLQTEHLTKENRREILDALTDMVRHLRNDDEVFIMAYGKKLNFEQDLTGNPQLLEDAMVQIKPEPGTALLDAVGFAAGHLERIATNKNRLLLVISDGRNTPSKDNPLALSQKLNTVRVDCIGLDVGGDSARRQLESLAAYSGGQVTFANSTTQLRTAAVQMAEGIGIEFPN